jgi:hypothetical protein
MDLVTALATLEQALASLDAYVRDSYSKSRQALQRNHDALAVVAAVVHKTAAYGHATGYETEDMYENAVLHASIHTLMTEIERLEAKTNVQ